MANNQKFTLTFDAQLNIGQMKGSLDQIRTTLSSLKLPASLEKGLQGTFQKLSQEVQNYEKIISQGINSDKDMKSLSASAEKILQLYIKLENEFKNIKNASPDVLKKMFPADVANNIEKATKALNNYKTTINDLNNKISSKKSELEKYQASLDVIKRTQAELQSKDVDKVNGLNVNEENLNKLKTAWEELSKAPQAYLDKVGAVSEKDLTKDQKSYFTKLKKDIDAAKQAYEQMQSAMDTKKGLVNAEKDITKYEESIRKIKNELAGLEQVLPKQQGDALKQLFEDLSKIKDLDLSKFGNNAESVEKAIQQLVNQALTNLKTNLDGVDVSLEKTGKSFNNNAEDVRKAIVVYSDFERRLQDVQSIKNRIQYFFGLSNAINLFKRAVHGAFETVKELDAAMTETAVVTQNTVSDMWAKLPEYTKRANGLGVSTLDAYKAATLYYQQGLNDDQAAALSVETLKMARIAGLEAADATDRMTNALRGFNMELDAVNAQKVDDVYSQLAAMSASNADEISTAMTKVASLAHSANMEFETTAAFLAQIIETTRESAETAGTALKTVVARFSEVKKLYDMDELKGKDEEGQTVDVNKVSQALRTAGIDLNKYFLGEVGLDDIFMELASKWDSLTSVQQRYIATQAAGSRQQSRFIALMQDYARTQELVSAAYKSNGASAKQFEKTQESLQSKLARLKNAWNEFLMGLANNVVIKAAVDTLTTLLNIINKLTGAFGDGAGGILKFLTALGALRGIGSLFSNSGLITRGLAKFGTTNFGKMLFPGASKVAAEMVAKESTKVGLWTKLFGAGASAGAADVGTAGVGASAAGAGLGAVAVPAAIITAIVAAVVGTVAVQDYFKSGKREVKAAEKAVATQQKAAEQQKKVADLQSDAYKRYIENEKVFNNSTDRVEKANAKAAMAEALADLASIDKGNVINNNGTYKVNKQYAQQLEQNLKEKENVTEATGYLAQAALQYAQAQKAEKAVMINTAYGKYGQWENAGGSWWQDTKWDLTHIGLNADERYLAIQSHNAAQEAKAASYYASAEAQMQAAVSGLLEGKYSDEIINSVASSYAKLFDSSAFNNEIQKSIEASGLAQTIAGTIVTPLGAEFTSTWAKSLINYSSNKEEYESVFGYGSAEGLNPKELATALAQYNATLGANDKAKQLADFGSTVNGQQILKALNGEIDFSEPDITAANNKLQQLATILGKDISVIQDQIRINQKARQENKKSNQSNIFEQALKSGYNINQDFADTIKGLDFDKLNIVSDIINQAAGKVGEQTFQSLFDTLPEMSNESLKEIQSFFNNFSLDNPITALEQLNNKIKEVGADSSFGKLLGDIKETNKALFESSNLVQSFLLSKSYEQLSDTIEEATKSNKKLNGKNIEDMAESCHELDALLQEINEDLGENTDSAQALAEAINLIGEGSLAIDQITDSLLAALGAGESFESLIGNVQQWIEDFNKGTDLTEGTQHITSVLEEAGKYVENWQFGNEPLQNIYDHIFGEGKYATYMDKAYEQGLPFDQIEAKLAGDIKHLSSLAENEGLGALQELNGKLTGLTSINGSDTEFKWDLSQYESASDAIQDVADKLQITDEAARAFIESWASHMWDLRQEWNDLNFGEAITAFSDELGKSAVITEAELDALSAKTGKTKTEILAALEEIRGKGKVPIVVSWQDEKGANLSGQDLIDKFNQTVNAQNITRYNGSKLETKTDYSNFLSGIDDVSRTVKTELDQTLNTLDFDTLHNHLVEAFKLTPAQATEVANNIAQQTGQSFSKEIQIPVKLEDGTIKTEARTITATTAEGLEAGINAAMEAANYALIAEEIASTSDFTTVGSKLEEAIKTGADTLPSAVSTAAVGVSVTIPVHWEPDPLPTGSRGTRAPRFTGGIVGSYAKGSENFHVNPGTSLIGEEGPEIVWNKDKKYSYITGTNGPEFADLQPGDRIFNAAETRRIIRNSHAAGGYMDSFASGGWKKPAAKSSGGGGNKGGGGSGKAEKEKTPEEWKNELDWLYNLMEDIAELERDQKAIEEQYEDYLADQTKTGGDLYRLLVQQLGNLYTQLNHQTFALEKREQEMREFMDTTNDKDQYLWYNWQDRTLEIDWDAIDKITDEEEYKHVKELVDEAEEIQDKIDGADDAIMDITNQIQELENIWRDTFTDFEDRVLDAIVKSYQQVIDKYSELNDTLNNSNTQILDSLQKQISLERQIRDNTKTEEEISDDEARLAYLRRDTSGGNDLAALQLERELADQRENYEDTLVDQAINRLQEDNDAAAQQRERQIEIMQAQLDYQSENGEFNAYVRELLTSAMGADGELLTNSDLVALLKEQENWDAMSDVSKQVWDEELNGTFKEVAAFLLKENAEQNGTFYTALTEAVKTVSTAIGSYSQAMTKLGNQIASAGSSGGGGGYSGGGGSSGSYNNGGTTTTSTTPNAMAKKSGGYEYGNYISSQYAKAYVPTSVPGAVSGVLKYKKYATGGLAGSTGLAWLDGTPQEPEYVLNARQTDAFLKLADVLPSMMGNGLSTTQNTFGATYVNLSVNLESVSPDYDVDRMVDLVKDKLYDAGSYRNVNSLSFLR